MSHPGSLSEDDFWGFHILAAIIPSKTRGPIFLVQQKVTKHEETEIKTTAPPSHLPWPGSADHERLPERDTQILS